MIKFLSQWKNKTKNRKQKKIKFKKKGQNISASLTEIKHTTYQNLRKI